MTTRLNVFVARATGMSRRAADDVIFEGRIRIGSEVVNEPGTQVEESDIVNYDGKRIRLPSEKTWLLMNKPIDFITTRKDESGRKTVMEILPKHLQRLFPVGRLDRDTEGVLLFTNDGETAHKLLHPSFEVERQYRVLINKPLSFNEIELIQRGVFIDGKKTSPARIFHARDSRPIYELTLTEGRYHEVKRIFAAVGREVLRLERTSHCGITAGNLKPGEWRLLTSAEIDLMKSRLVHNYDSDRRT